MFHFLTEEMQRGRQHRGTDSIQLGQAGFANCQESGSMNCALRGNKTAVVVTGLRTVRWLTAILSSLPHQFRQGNRTHDVPDPVLVLLRFFFNRLKVVTVIHCEHTAERVGARCSMKARATLSRSSSSSCLN